MNVTGVQQTIQSKLTFNTIQNEKRASDISNSSKSADSVYEKIASQYDVRNISYFDIRQLSQNLYDSGEIDLTTLSVLDSFTMEFFPSDGSSFRYLEGNVDYMSKLKDYADFQKQYTGKNDDLLENALSILKKIDNTRNNQNINIFI